MRLNLILSKPGRSLIISLMLLSATAIFAEDVQANSSPNIWGWAPKVVPAGQWYEFAPQARDPDGDTLRFSIKNKPDWAWFSNETGRFRGTPPAAGTYGNIVISVSDGRTSASLPAFSIKAEAENNSSPSIWGTPPKVVTAGSWYEFTPQANDPDGDTLSFSITNKPDWAWFNKKTGRFRGTPPAVGTYGEFVISVSDGSKSASLSAFQIEAMQDSTPPPAEYVGFGSVTKGALSCPTTPTTYRVTSLSGGSGAGTLRDAVSQDCRHIVFDVAGDVNLGDLQISRSYLTIDGSTAPAPGITLVNVGRLVLEASGGKAVHDVIVNNIRAVGQGGSIEGNDLWELDGSSGAPIYNVVLDHLTMSDSGDGNVDIYGDVHDITLSNSLMKDSVQGQHYSQSSGLRERITIYGNVYARINERQPRIRYNTRQLDLVGNVVYGWGWFEGGAAGLNIDVGTGTPSANIEQNVYHHVSGLHGSADNALVIASFGGSWFFDGNSWPAGESQGDTAGNAGRVSMVYKGIDYAAPRTRADITVAGTKHKTTGEQDLLQTIAGAVSGGGSEPPEPPAPPVGESSYRGIPDPSASLGFDVWADYPADQTVSGDRGIESLTCNGTAANPCLIDATSATFTIVQLKGSYAILQGGRVDAPSSNGPFVTLQGCNRCVVRDVEVSGPRTDEGHSSAIDMADDSVWIRGSIHGFGDNRSAAGEQDFHGIKIQRNNVWVLDAEIYDVSGDSIQVGDASRGAGTNVYIGGGFFHDNRENGVDIKDSTNIVVSGVTMSAFRPTSSDPGSAIVIHDDAFDAKIYDNVISDTAVGIVSSGKDGHVINKNTIEAYNVGIELRNTKNILVTENDITAPERIDVQGGLTGTIQE